MESPNAGDTSSIQLEVKESNIDNEKNQSNAKTNQFTVESNEKEINTLQQELTLTKSHPSIRDVINHEVTWKEFLGFYNVLRIGIAAICAILICLFVFGIIYLINPNKCRYQRKKPNRIQWNPIANKIMICLELILMFGPVVKIFGFEWKWSSKKINLTFLLLSILIFLIFMPYGFIMNMSNGLYTGIAIAVFILIVVIYLFLISGFYVFWMIIPFVIAFAIGSGCVFIGALIFRNIIKPDSFFFGIAYNIFLTVLQFVIFKFYLYSFPIKYGRVCTCPCNKGKIRQFRENITVKTELSDMVIFWYSMVVISTVETFRIAEYIELIDQRGGFGGLYQFFAFGIIIEIITRNGIIWEILYKCLKKGSVPARTRVMSIYFGAKYQAEWIPIWCALLMNAFGYGPFKTCAKVRDIELGDTVNVNGAWWIFGFMFGSELLQGIGSEIMVRIARYFKWYGMKNEKGEDPPRNVTLVKVNLFPMIWILIQCYIFSYESFVVDKGNRAVTIENV